MKLLESEFLTFGKNLKQCSHLSFILQVFLAPDQKQKKKKITSLLFTTTEDFATNVDEALP